MRDPEQVARAQHAAARLESAWERWRSLQGLADTPAQPVVGYVGYALKEPWGQPRAVIGFSADEAERLAEFLEHGNSDAQPSLLPVSVAQPVKKSSGSGPQPTFTPQPSFTPQAPAKPSPAPSAPPPPPAQRQSSQRTVAASAPSSAPSGRTAPARGGHRKNVSKLTSSQAQPPAPKNQNGSPDQPGGSAEAPKEALHATAIPEQASLADMSAERSLRASYPVPRVGSASYQEPMRHYRRQGSIY